MTHELEIRRFWRSSAHAETFEAVRVPREKEFENGWDWVDHLTLISTWSGGWMCFQDAEVHLHPNPKPYDDYARGGEWVVKFDDGRYVEVYDDIEMSEFEEIT